MDDMVTCERGHYYIEDEMNISGTSFFIAHDRKSKQPYMVGEKQSSDIMTKYSQLMVTDNYVSALEEWNRRIALAIAQLKSKGIRT